MNEQTTLLPDTVAFGRIWSDLFTQPHYFPSAWIWDDRKPNDRLRDVHITYLFLCKPATFFSRVGPRVLYTMWCGLDLIRNTHLYLEVLGVNQDV